MSGFFTTLLLCLVCYACSDVEVVHVNGLYDSEPNNSSTTASIVIFAGNVVSTWCFRFKVHTYFVLTLRRIQYCVSISCLCLMFLYRI